MSNNEKIQLILEELQTILHFLERPVVWQQIVTLIAVFTISGLLSTGFWYIFRRRLRNWGEQRLSEKGQRYWNLFVLITENITFPLFAGFLLWLVIQQFQAQKELTELLIAALPLVGLLSVYRFLLVILYTLGGREVMKHYHYRLIAPLFIFYVILWVSNWVVNLSVLADIQLIQLFSKPVTIGSLTTAMISLYFLINIASATQAALEGLIIPRTYLDTSSINAVLTLGRYIVISLGAIIVASALGFDTTTLTVIGGGLSVGIGFGLQKIVSNFISGIILLFEQSLRPGDVVQVDGLMGKVQKMSIRSTTIRTYNNIELIVPNETLFNSTVTTYTQSDRIVRLLISIGVSYDCDPKEVIQILLNVAQDYGRVLQTPAPTVFFEAFGASSLDFNLAVWVNDPDLHRKISSDLRLMIFKRLTEQGIEIPYPQRDIHIRSDDTAVQKSGIFNKPTQAIH